MSDPQQPTSRTIAVVGDVYRFLATGDETEGKYALWEAYVPPGGGPPPHLHTREVEAFFGLSGRIALDVEGQRRELTAGEFAHVPIGTLHSFRNETNEPATMLVLIAPAGLERMFLEVGQPVEPGARAAPPTPPDEIARLMAAAPRFGIELRLPTQAEGS